MKMKKLIFTIFVSTMLTACTNTDAPFVGKWQQKNGGRIIEFTKNGNSFLFIDGRDKYPATIGQDNTLQVSAPLLGTIVFAYSKNSDTIVAMGDEFSRVK